MLSYDRGYSDGLADGLLMNQPVGENGYTFAEYQRIVAKYKRAIGFMPSDYDRGYANGLDQRAREAGFGEPTQEQVDKFYEEL